MLTRRLTEYISQGQTLVVRERRRRILMRQLNRGVVEYVTRSNVGGMEEKKKTFERLNKQTLTTHVTMAIREGI